MEWYEMGHIDYVKNRQRVAEMRQSREGKFTVLGIDMFDGTDWIKGRYNSLEEAFEMARKERKEALTRATGPGIADRYYVYAPNGAYLGEG